MKVPYFQEQGLEVFLDKLRAQGWLELFANTCLGYSVPDLTDFYANCSVTNAVVTSEVNGKKLKFNAKDLGAILGVPAEGFDVYVRADKTVLGTARLLQLTQTLSQQTRLKTPPVRKKKSDMTSLHQLLFWFIIKNIIPRGQGNNLADAMDQCFIDLMDRGEQINLPAIMIRHISRIVNTSREHDLGYGFLLTLMFEHFGISLQKKEGVQMVDEIGNSTLMGCGFKLVKGAHVASEQGSRTPFPLVPGCSSSEPFVDALLLDQSRLKTELAEVKTALAEEKVLNAKRHEDLISILSILTAKISPPPP